MLKRVKDKIWNIIDKPRQVAFSVPLLSRLPIKLQRWLYFALSPVFLLLLLLTYLLWGIPFPTQITSQAKNPVSTQILDRNGKLIYEIFEEKKRTPVNLESLPKYIPQATIAIEDKNFYNHWGLSASGMARALFKTTTGELQGGSTITQQLVKTTLLTPERTLKRKIREILLTLIVEGLYSKDKILEMYLNNIPYGGTAWGIESASHTYFGKSAKELNLSEASLLAGLPQAPTRYSPFGAHPKLAKERQKQVLRSMAEEGFITEEEAKKAQEVELTYVEKEGLKAPHFALFVKDQLVEKYGEDVVERGGLRVTTTLDLDVQEFAENTVKTELEKLAKARVRNGAVIVSLPQTGEILAMVGSKNYFAKDEDGKVNVTLSERQPGSSIKPINYALGILKGNITAASPLADIPTCFSVTGQSLYCPLNYDNSHRGATQVRFALGNSLNIPAVRVLALNGLSEFVDFSRSLGLETFKDPSRYGLSLTLGGGEVRMIDMVTAFGSFATNGIKQSPIAILEVKDFKGNTLEKTTIRDGDRVMPQGVAYIIAHILSDNNARSQVFGVSSSLVVSEHPEVSVKTGTTNDLRDNWTIGFTPEVTVATWVGNNNNEPMGRIVSGVTGAAPIWNKIIKFSLDKIEAGETSATGTNRNKHSHLYPQKPAEVTGTNVCATTGQLPPGDPNNPETAGCQIRFEFFLDDFPPKSAEPLIRPVTVFRDTQMLAPADSPEDQIEIKDKQIIIDPLGSLLCLDCPLQNWNITIKPGDIITPNLAPARQENQSSPIGGQNNIPLGGE